MSMPESSRTLAVRRLWMRRIFALVGVACFFGLTWAPKIGDSDNRFILASALCYALVGLSMNVLVGYAGQISLGQGAIFGFGAFVLGNLVARADIPWLVALPLTGLATAALALIIGFPALRVRGLNLAVLTLAFHFVMQRSILRSHLFTPGAAGIEFEPPTIFGHDLDAVTDAGKVPMLLAIMATIVVIWLIDRNLTRSRAGRAFFALRQDEQVASSFGIPVARYKLLAFAISGFYAGLAGALFATLGGKAVAEDFEFTLSIEFLVFAVLGGLGSRGGTAAGAAFPVLTRRLLDFLANAGQMLGGVLLVATLIRYPGGLAQQGREIKHGGILFLRRGKLWFLAFVGVGVASFALAILGPYGLDALLGLWSWDVSPLWATILGIGTLAISFQVGARLLGRRAFGAAARGVSPSDAVAAIEKAEAAAQKLTIASTNGAVPFRRADVARQYKGPLLAVDDVAIRFGGVRALDGVTLEVRQGELIGIMGPNGSGKTTMLNCISGFLKPNRGDVRLRGESLLRLPPHDRAARGLGRTFQNIGLVKQETVFDNFLIAQHLVCRYGAMEGLIRTGGVVSEERRLRRRAHAAIELLGLGDVVGEQVRSLPHGRAKLVELGCSLVSGPEMLLLDEPAAGVSPQEAEALGTSLKQIAATFGVTILMIEHHVPLMLSTCDYIYVLNFGQLLTHGEPQEVARHPDVIAAYLGSTATTPAPDEAEHAPA